MIKKVQVIPYKTVKGMVYYFLGKRRGLDLWQPITGHVADNIKGETIAEAAKREAQEEIGISQFKIFFFIKSSFTFISGRGLKCKEYVFAADIADQRIKLEKAEFEKYDFFSFEQALKKLCYQTQKKMLAKTNEMIVKKQYPKIFVISGPGASGKETIIKELLNGIPTLVLAKNCTTRHIRRGEKTINKYFLTEKKFKEYEKVGKLFESNYYNGNWYGTMGEEVERPVANGHAVICELDTNGVRFAKKRYGNIVSIYILVTLADLKKRFILRGQDLPAIIERRLEIARKENLRSGEYDYRIKNIQGKLGNMVKNAIKIIKKETGE